MFNLKPHCQRAYSPSAGEKKNRYLLAMFSDSAGFYVALLLIFLFYLIMITRGGGDECAMDARRLYTTSRNSLRICSIIIGGRGA